VPDGYELTFDDAFDGDKLDPAKWKTRYIYGNETTDRLNDEQQLYRDNANHVVEGGTLKLVAKKVENNPKTATTPFPINYESGMVRSLHTQRYGYFEARVKFCNAIGTWPVPTRCGLRPSPLNSLLPALTIVSAMPTKSMIFGNVF